MSLNDLSPEKITKMELSSFCEQMDQMYFLPAEKSKQHYWRADGKQASAIIQRPVTKIESPQQSHGRVSIDGLVSAIEFLHMEANSSSASSPHIDDPLLQPAHLASMRSLPPPTLGPQLHVVAGHGILDSTVDWCGQPTSRTQWLKNRVNALCAPAPQRLAPASASAASSSGRHLTKAQQPSATLQPLRASSARPASAASIGADYRDLSEAEVAADVDIRHLGGSSCASSDERRYWLAASRRPYPIRKSLPDKRNRRDNQYRLEFVSLLRPGPSRAPQLSQGSTAHFLPPPASPSSRPATANAGPEASNRTAGRPLIGRPRPSLSAPSAAVGSFSDFSDLTMSPRPQLAAATTISTGQEAMKASAARVSHRGQPSRQRLRDWPTMPFSQPVELELLGNRFRYNGNELIAPQSKVLKQQLTLQSDCVDQELAELEHIVSCSSAARPVHNPQIIFNSGSGNSSGREQASDNADIVGDDDTTKYPNGTSTLAFEQGEYKYPTGAEQAALIIQSSYRGYSTRRLLSRVEQLARAQGFESVKALRRYYCSLVVGSQCPDEQQMLNFLENKRRIELAFDTTIRKNCPASVADLTKVFNVCGHFPNRRAVELALSDWQSRRGRQPGVSPRMSSYSSAPDRQAAVEIFYLLLVGGVASPSSPRRRSPRQPPMTAKAKLNRPTPPDGQQPSLSVRGLSKLR